MNLMQKTRTLQRIREKLTMEESRTLFAHHMAVAADFVRGFDRQVAHPWLLSDCLMMKFNQMPERKRARKNKHPTAVALTEVINAITITREEYEKLRFRSRAPEWIKAVNRARRAHLGLK